MEDKHVLMFSGGLDSYLLLLTLLDNGITPTLVYSSHGSRNNEEQLYLARKLARKHNLSLKIDYTLDLKKWERSDAYIPNRNGLLAMVGALYGNRIYFAIMDGEQSYDDCKQETFKALSLALTMLSGSPIIVDSPFFNLTKSEVIQRLDPKHLPSLTDTYSCHRGGMKHCGHCTACFRRWVAFELNGISDVWEVHPARTGLAEGYHRLVTSGKSGYGEKRDNETIRAFEQVGVRYD
jgi:7-cyano-7-deazaguanine synthase